MRAACLLPLVLLTACAGAPKSSAPVVAPSPPRTAAATSVQPAAGDKKFEQIDASNIADAQAAGYKVVNEKGKTLLCRKDLITGTRLKYVTTCLTAMEWKETADNAREGVKPNPAWKPERGN